MLGQIIKNNNATIHRSVATILILTFFQSLVATVEVCKISEGKALQAALWGALNAACYIVVAVTIVIEPRRKILIPFYILACALATYFGTLIGKP